MNQHRIHNARTGKLLAISDEVGAWRAANPTYRVAFIKAPPGRIDFYVGVPPKRPLTNPCQRKA